MSYYNKCLRAFHLTLDDFNLLSEAALKTIYRQVTAESHPDRGGDAENDIDFLKEAYLYLLTIVRRKTGGRATLEEVSDPNTLKNGWMEYENSIKNMERVDSEFDLNLFNKEFVKNLQLSSNIVKEDDGYGGDDRDYTEHNMDIEHIDLEKIAAEREAACIITKKDNINSENFNRVFTNTENIIKTESIAFYRDSILTGISPIMGALISDTTKNYTCAPNILNGKGTCYTDLFAAFSVENTIYDELDFNDFRTSISLINTTPEYTRKYSITKRGKYYRSIR
jgi:hypothetical protein